MESPEPATHYLPDPGLKLLSLTDIEIFKGLSGYVTEDELRSFFRGFGETAYVKIPPSKGCGFVQSVQRHAAEMAIIQMQGYPEARTTLDLPVPHTGTPASATSICLSFQGHAAYTPVRWFCTYEGWCPLYHSTVVSPPGAFAGAWHDEGPR